LFYVFNNTGNASIDGTFRRVHVTIFAVEKQYLLLCLCR